MNKYIYIRGYLNPYTNQLGDISFDLSFENFGVIEALEVSEAYELAEKKWPISKDPMAKFAANDLVVLIP